MDMLGNLLGGGQNRQQYEDFVGRYDRGAPWDGITDDEATSRYRDVAPRLSQQEYEDSARDAFERLSPRERREFAQLVRQRARERNGGYQDLDGDGDDDRYEDSGQLAQLTSRMHREQPGMLEQLLGGGGGGGGGNPLAKGALAGIAAMAAKRFMGGGR